jgi:hypothetical protein
MTKRQALLRPHSVALSDSVKKSTRPPSSKRLSEAEAITRLEPLGWTIISGYAGLSEPCLNATSLWLSVKSFNAQTIV